MRTVKGKADLAVIGGGILGLAHALMAAKKGMRVILFEKDRLAQGASVRNFGFFFPLGMPPGKIYDRARRSRETWLELAGKARFWNEQEGALIAAYAEDEWQVLKEFHECSSEYGCTCTLFNAQKTLERSPNLNPEGLVGSLYDQSAICVDPREAVAKIPAAIAKEHGIQMEYGKTVTRIELPFIYAGKECWEVKKAIVCPGQDLSTLYQETFSQSSLKLCKLQMMRSNPQPDHWRMGPMLAFGLTLQHYDSFALAPSLPRLKERFQAECTEMLNRGIHVMVTQHGDGMLVIGDSHDYGDEVAPFDSMLTDKMVLDYLAKRFHMPDSSIGVRWHGIYAKDMEKGLYKAEPENNVFIVNGIGGIGMTTAFGVAEETAAEWL